MFFPHWKIERASTNPLGSFPHSVFVGLGISLWPQHSSVGPKSYVYSYLIIKRFVFYGNKLWYLMNVAWKLQRGKITRARWGREGVIATAPWEFVRSIATQAWNCLSFLCLLCVCWHQMDVNIKNSHVFFTIRIGNNEQRTCAFLMLKLWRELGSVAKIVRFKT